MAAPTTSSPSPPKSPPKDGSGILGKFPRKYNLLELKKYTYRSCVQTDSTVFYYQGHQGRLVAEEAGDKEEEEKVSFLCFDEKDKQQASLIYCASSGINDRRILRSYFCEYNKEIKKYLVCFERFDNFFDEQTNTDFLSLRNTGSISMPMHPHPTVRSEILELTAAINRMHLAEISNSRLDSKSSYVWCKGDLKMFADYSRDGRSDSDWSATLKIDLSLFKDFLDRELLRFNNAKKVSFLKCFDNIHHYYPMKEKSLKMIMMHPFLMSDKKAYLEFFSWIGHWLAHGESGTFKLEALKEAFRLEDFDTDICDESGRWTRNDMHDVFKKMIGPEEAYECRYWRHSAKGLVKFLRDVYEHFTDEGITLDEVFDEVEKHWPCFIDRLHEYVYLFQL